MKTKFLVCALLLFSYLTSWASFPPRITQAEINQIRVGQTTEVELVHLFGTPTTRSTDLAQRISIDWFRSVPAPAQSYIPLIGPFLGGLTIEAQQLSVVLTPDGRVLRYTVHSSRDTLHGAAQVTRTTLSRTSYSK